MRASRAAQRSTGLASLCSTALRASVTDAQMPSASAVPETPRARASVIAPAPEFQIRTIEKQQLFLNHPDRLHEITCLLVADPSRSITNNYLREKFE